MAQRKGTLPRKKIAVSFIIRDVEEKYNRAGVNSLKFDPANHTLFTAGRDSIIRMWDVEDSDSPSLAVRLGGKATPEQYGDIRHLKSMEHHTDWISDIVLCMDGKNIMSASSDTTLKVWDISRGTCLSTLRTHKDYVRCLAYAKEREQVASAGLDKSIFLWDVKTLTSLTATNNTVTTSTLPGHKESIYSIAMNPEATVLVSGSTDKLLRVWDPRTCNRTMKLKGHTDNVRVIRLNRDGTLVLSGSSDGAVRLWSLGQQRCIETFHVHDQGQGVWSLAVNEDFNTFYSGGRDRRVCMTELRQGGEEGLVLFTEEAPILDLALDTTGRHDSVWVATTATHINKWSVSPESVANGYYDVEGLSEEDDEEEDSRITDIDDPTPLFTRPLATIPGGSSIKEYKILNNRQQVLTRDSKGEVVLWDVLHACKLEDLGKVDLEEEAEKRKGKFYIPNWFSVEIKLGMLTIKLEECDCFSAWLMGCNTLLDTAAPDIKVNLGALMLKALFEHWPSVKTPEPENVSLRSPTLETLVKICGGEEMEAGLWEELGTALGLSSERLEKIALEEEADLEKRKQCILHAWVTESEEVTWERFVEALETTKQEDLAKKVREEYCEEAEDSKDANSKINVKFFSVPSHTPVILSEAADCGTTMTRVLCGDMSGMHETRQLNNYCPIWVMDTVCQKKLPDAIKLNFFLGQYGDPKNDRLSAQDVLTIRKVQEYVYDKLYGEEGKDSGKDGRGSDINIICAEQVLDPVLDLRTVKYSTWRSGGDMKLFYRLNENKDEEMSSPPPVVEDTSEETGAEETKTQAAPAADVDTADASVSDTTTAANTTENTGSAPTS